MLETVAGVGLRGTEKQRRHPAAAVAYGAANAMIVDVAVGLIATGATVVAGMPFWPHAHRALRSG